MTTLHAYEWGDAGAPPVVCLHGVNAHGLRFRRLAEERLAKSHRVLALDLRGHGHSEWEPPWDLDTHLDDLVETTTALGVATAAWVGHSFGGRLAIELAAREPERVERIVLLDPAVWVPPPRALVEAERERADRSFGSREEALAVRQRTSQRTSAAVIEGDLDLHLVHSDDGRYRYRYCQSAVVNAFAEMAKRPPLEHVRVPVLLLRAPEAGIVPDALVETCRELLRELEVVDVPGGHIVMWDAFDETAEAIERFLSGGLR